MNKKSAITLAALACLWGAVQAQSSVTVFGVVDVGLTRLTGNTVHQTLVNTDGNTSSRFGFRGVEELGQGLKLGFWLESGFSPDTGVGGSTNTNNQTPAAGSTTGFSFGRRSIISLTGAFGEVRVGRDYVPTFANLTVSMHPFGTNGVGSSGVLFYPVAAGGTTARTNVRAFNSIGYALPATLGGWYGHAMVALGENASNAGAQKDDGNYRGARVGYQSGPFNAAVASGTTRYATGNYQQSNAAANYKLGPVQLMALWGRNKVGVTRTTAQMVGLVWQLGPGELRLAHTGLKSSGVASDATHTALGYVMTLSKRTALYTTAARVNNKGTGRAFNVGLPVTVAGGNSSGFEVGIRHSF